VTLSIDDMARTKKALTVELKKEREKTINRTIYHFMVIHLRDLLVSLEKQVCDFLLAISSLPLKRNKIGG
jgi:hypothetical protein